MAIRDHVINHSVPCSIKKCAKCGLSSGNDWKQCEGSCPVPCSPHFNEKEASKWPPQPGQVTL